MLPLMSSVCLYLLLLICLYLFLFWLLLLLLLLLLRCHGLLQPCLHLLASLAEGLCSGIVRDSGTVVYKLGQGM
jgi:hypothetical protein